MALLRMCRTVALVALALIFVAPAAESVDLNQHGLTGSWYESDKSGQGIELEIFPNLVGPGVALAQGAWFTFDITPAGGDDRQRWYVFNGNAQSGAPNVPITIYQNVGGNFNAVSVKIVVASARRLVSTAG